MKTLQSIIEKKLSELASNLLDGLSAEIRNRIRAEIAQQQNTLDKLEAQAKAFANRTSSSRPAQAKPKPARPAARPTKQQQIEIAYNFLGVRRTDPDEMVKKVYKAKSMVLHPDRPTGSKEDFQRLEAAYRLVMGDRKRGT